MAITWYTSAGQPSDSVGAVGDLNWDTTNRITWGPKASNNSWVGTAYSNIGPTGPAMLSGTGAPASGLGQIGNGYTDTASGLTYLKSSSGWSQTGSIIGPSGAIGPQGFSSLTNQAACYTGQVQSVGVTLTSTAQTMQNGATSTAAYVMFPQASAFQGATAYNNGVACTITLVDTTNNSTVFSTGSIASNSNYNSGILSATTYPIVANRLYQWMITGSGSSSVGINPVFLQPSVLTAQGTGIFSGLTTPASSTFSSTVQYICQGNTLKTSSATSYAYAPVRAGGVIGGIMTYTPSTQGAASATVTATLYYYVQSSGSGGAGSVTFSATNNGVPQAAALGSVASMSVGTTYYIGLTGSGTGLVDLKLQLVV